MTKSTDTTNRSTRRETLRLKPSEPCQPNSRMEFKDRMEFMDNARRIKFTDDESNSDCYRESDGQHAATDTRRSFRGDSFDGSDDGFRAPPPPPGPALSTDDDGKSYFCLHCCVPRAQEGPGAQAHVGARGSTLCAHCEHSAGSAEGLEAHMVERARTPGCAGEGCARGAGCCTQGLNWRSTKGHAGGEAAGPCGACGKEFKFLSVMKVSRGRGYC